MAGQPSPQNQLPSINNLLQRPAEQRIREYKYRFAQAMIFGLPVIALQQVGLRLGGSESAVWVGLMQVILAGWVMYVAATGMMIEGVLLRKLTSDAAAAMLAAIVYLTSLGTWIRLLLQQLREPRTFWFDIAVMVLIIWCGLQWWLTARRARA